MKKRISGLLLAVVMLLGLLPTAALAADTTPAEVAEQYTTLIPGETYWFDLYGEKMYDGATGAPDQLRHWSPFTYVGTVNAYVLNSASLRVAGAAAAASTATDASAPYGYTYDHSLFVSDYTMNGSSWDTNNENGRIFGKTYTGNGVSYTLRAMSVGSGKTGEDDTQRGTPANNEWDVILDKGTDYIKNFKDVFNYNVLSWGQDAPSAASYRGGKSARHYGTAASTLDKSIYLSGGHLYYRPVLELPVPGGDLPADGLAVVEIDLNGGAIGRKVESGVKIVVKAGEGFAAPDGERLTAPEGYTFGGWKAGETTYQPGDTVPAGTAGLSAQWKADHEHIWAEAWNNNATHHWHVCNAEGCDIEDYDVCGEDGAAYAAHVYDDAQDTICNTCGYTRAAQTYEISGTVTDSEGVALSGATVKLMQGSTQVSSTTTDSSGHYSFMGIAPGLYNVTAKKDGVTKTILVEITNDNAANQGIKMPNGNINSVVEVKPNTPAVVAGGVDEIAEGETVNPGDTVTVTLTVEKQDAPADKPDIETIAAGKTVGLYLDLSLLKTTMSGGDTTEDPITDTGSRVLEIVVPYDFTGKKAVTVYRKHGTDAAQALIEADTRADGTFRLDRTNGRLYIYTSKFSTYAVGYVPDGGGSSSAVSTPPAYSVQVPADTPNGSVSVSPKYASWGTTVTICATPDEGYRTGKVTVLARNGKEVPVTIKGDGEYAFTMPDDRVTVDVAFVKVRTGYADCPRDNTCPLAAFTDTSVAAWYHDGVHYCVENGLMVGYSNGRFKPDDNLSRAQFVQILFNQEGRPVVNYLLTFPDLSGGAWYAEAVRWAAAQSVVSGYRNGMFGPDDNITREQLAVMLWRYAGSPAAAGKELHFTDVDKISGYALEALCWATEQGLLHGNGDGVLDPAGWATRAEAAAMLQRFFEG